MNETLSKKIKTVSFLLMIMVVFIHSYNIDMKPPRHVLPQIGGFNWIIQNFISNGLTRVAVPLFFTISGYLFALRLNEMSFDIYKDKILSRFKTLLIPFIFWSLAAILLYLLLQSFPASKPFFTKKLIADYTTSEWFNAVFYMPVAYQLWFLRDLIVLVIISPLLIWSVRHGGFLLLFVLSLVWFCNRNLVFLSSEGLFFFSTGLYIARIKPNHLLKFNPRGLLLGWMIFLTIKIIARYNEFYILENALLKVSILVGMAALWRLFDILGERNNSFAILSRFSWASFFLYLFHEPSLTIIKKALFYLIPVEAPVYLITYFVAPAIIIVASVGNAWILKKYTPNFYNLITGGR